MFRVAEKAIVLLSGGIDSTTTFAVAKKQGYQVFALSFKYGQRHEIELDAAKQIAINFHVKKHLILDLNLRTIGGSALTANLDIPKNRSFDNGKKNIPITYVPARNIIFLSYALAYAESLGARDIFIGANAVDYSGYPDCRGKFFKSFSKMANIGTKAGSKGERFVINTPLLKLKKSDIIKKGLNLGVDYSLTMSCYDPDENGYACGLCDSCLFRKKGFKEAGVLDPIKYRN